MARLKLFGQMFDQWMIIYGRDLRSLILLFWLYFDGKRYYDLFHNDPRIKILKRVKG